MNPTNITPDPKQNNILRGEGMDCIANLIHDQHIRPIDVNGEQFGSLVDVIKVFAPNVKRANQYWSDNKTKILSNDDGDVDPELYAACVQLPIVAADGKKRETEVAPLWVCVYVALTISKEFRKRLARFSASEIKYRMGNVARGSEWAADSIHKQLIDGGATMIFDGPDDDQPFKAK